jgi:membrane-bound lytic murein transglycosylase D
MPSPSVRPSTVRLLAVLVVLLGACAPLQGRHSVITPLQSTAPEAERDAAVEPVVITPVVTERDRVEMEAQRLFGDSAPPAADAVDAALAQYTGDLPRLELDAYAEHSRVEHYVQLFSGSARTRTQQRLSRGTQYDAMIRTKLRAGGIPEDFRFLALIESGFEPDAVSSASAVGLWQFMPATARGVGLRVDWWVDERRDVVKSTDAAVTFLNQLQRQFGSLYLAAAAYNGGPGRVQRGLSRFAREVDRAEPDDRFFTLATKNALAAETKNYVPQLIAAALIGRDPVAFGVRIDTMPAFTYDEVMVPASTALAAVGVACAVDVAAIVRLNGQLLRGMTPPDRAETLVRVPRGCAPGFDARLALIEPEARSGVETREIAQGETLTGLAKSLGLTTTALRQFNPKLVVNANGSLRSGTTITVPTAAARAAWRSVPDPVSGVGAAGGSTHTVSRGETLSGIAKRYGTTVSRLKALNGMKSDRLAVGKRLRVR